MSSLFISSPLEVLFDVLLLKDTSFEVRDKLCQEMEVFLDWLFQTADSDVKSVAMNSHYGEATLCP